MQMGIASIGTCVLFGIILLIIYFSKKRINGKETKLYNYLLVLSFIGLIIEILCCITVANQEKFIFLTILVNRLWLLHISNWLFLFTVYIVNISFRKNIGKMYNHIKRFLLVLYFTFNFSNFLKKFMRQHSLSYTHKLWKWYCLFIWSKY